MLRLIVNKIQGWGSLRSSLQQAVPMTTRAGVSKSLEFPLIGSALGGMVLFLYASDLNVLIQGLQKECTPFSPKRLLDTMQLSW